MLRIRIPLFERDAITSKLRSITPFLNVYRTLSCIFLGHDLKNENSVRETAKLRFGSRNHVLKMASTFKADFSVKHSRRQNTLPESSFLVPKHRCFSLSKNEFVPGTNGANIILTLHTVLAAIGASLILFWGSKWLGNPPRGVVREWFPGLDAVFLGVLLLGCVFGLFSGFVGGLGVF